MGAVLAVFVVQALSARSALIAAADDASVLQQQLAAGDTATVEETLTQLQDHARSARSSTDGVLWRAGARLPLVGDSIGATTTAGREIDRVATEALPAAVDLAGTLDAQSFTAVQGRIDLDALVTARPQLAVAADALARSDQELAEAASGSLVFPLERPVNAASRRLAIASKIARSADVAARLAPEMLGATGERRYLLLAQDPAESRPLGGVVTTFAIVRADDGHLSVERTGSAADLGPLDQDAITDEERAVLGVPDDADLSDVTRIPDFARAAELARGLVDEPVDGVVSVDPVSLGYLLTGLGPVGVDEEITLDRDNAVDVLMNQVYVEEAPEQQREFLERAYRQVLGALFRGAGQPVTTLRALARGVEEKRVMVWSARPEEQDVLDTTQLAGTGTGGDLERLGVYVSDVPGSKMQYYLRTSTTAVSTRCSGTGRQTFTTVTELLSQAPRNVPLGVAGDASAAMTVEVRLISPTGGRVTAVRVGDDVRPVSGARWQDRNVARVAVRLEPGQTVRLVSTVVGAPERTADAVLSTTPDVDPLRNDVRIASACVS